MNFLFAPNLYAIKTRNMPEITRVTILFYHYTSKNSTYDFVLAL